MQLIALLDQLEAFPIRRAGAVSTATCSDDDAQRAQVDPSHRAPEPDLPATAAAGFPCRENDPELWFAERPEEVELAKAFCLECPVVSGCLAGALERGEPWGVWGGQLLVQGAVVPRKRPRGRPRKDSVAA